VPHVSSAREFRISLVMIVRDEERCLGRCLASVTDLVDEIVVVDTGSADRTVQIAESYGARVARFEWVDDFAAARNFSLEQASHPWRLILDADEWVADRETARAVLDTLGSTPPRSVGIVTVLQMDETTGELEHGTRLPVPRVLPPYVRFEGIVHEQPVPSTRTFALDLTLGHDGYTSPASARKTGRNLALLEAALEHDPANPYLWFQLGNDHLTHGRLEDALPALVRSYNLLRDETGAPTMPERRTWEHLLVVRLLQTLTLLRRFEEAVAVGEQECRLWPDSSDFFYVFGDAVRLAALVAGTVDPARADRLTRATIDCWSHALEQGDLPHYGGALTERATTLAAEGLGELYARLARPGDAATYAAIAAARRADAVPA